MHRLWGKRVLVLMLIVNTCLLGIPRGVLGAPISTQTLIQLEERQARIDQIQSVFVREDVRNALIELGVSPEDASERVAALTDDELVILEQRMEHLPAGGSALAIIGGVFLVLLILELVGIIDIFKKI